ncbi:piggyBac transposable element-derived protein 3-like [Macrobrachium rosenbergii]|uniref:piggyBac transposable element-derived protein 3-like n=1 Tax=Macrobrachium rosenbergii TaxID=79674 RepID=UPI0034D3E767
MDESMVPYYGQHSAKMFIQGKPIKFGYKIWALCGIDGYPYKLQLYRVTKHKMYFDNFFTSYVLLKSLAEQNIKVTGTVRDNKNAGAAKLMKPNAVMKKSTRGEFDLRCDGEVFCVNGMTTLCDDYK